MRAYLNFSMHPFWAYYYMPMIILYVWSVSGVGGLKFFPCLLSKMDEKNDKISGLIIDVLELDFIDLNFLKLIDTQNLI